MSYTLKTNKANKSNYGKQRLLSDIKYIVIHYTANDGDTDENNGKYFKNNIVKSSAHYFIDSDSVTQSVPDNYIAWHCGASVYKHAECRNANSIGVEICDDVKNGVIYPSESTIINVINFVKTLMNKYNIDSSHVIRHYDVTGKLCPAYWCGNSEKDSLWKTAFWNKLTTDTDKKKEETMKKVTYETFKSGYMYSIPFDLIDRVEYCQMSGNKGETVTSAAKRIKWNNRSPDIIINAELFNMSTYKPASSIVDEGKTSLLVETYGIGFKDHKTPVFSYKNNINAIDFVGGYPTLVKSGKKGFNSDPPGLSGSRARTAIGLNSNTFFVCVVKDGVNDATLTEVANEFIAKGATNAIGLDGGGSTAFQTNEFSYEQGRKVRGFICLWYNGGKGNRLSPNSFTSSTNTNTASSMKRDPTATGGVTLYTTASSGLKIRDGNSNVIKILPLNTKVIWYGYYSTNYKISGTWYYVKCSDGTTGYVSATYVKKK